VTVLAGAERRKAEHDAMLKQARVALSWWREARNGDSADAEYGAACAMEQALRVLVKALS
jgi:hypothetical protein